MTGAARAARLDAGGGVPRSRAGAARGVPGAVARRRRGAHRGEPLRHLRQRPAPDRSRAGAARHRARPRVQRASSSPSATTSRQWDGRRPRSWAVRRRGAAACEACRAGLPSQCRAARRDHERRPRGRSPATSRVDRRSLLARARGHVPARRRPWPNRWPSRLHGITRPRHRARRAGAGDRCRAHRRADRRRAGRPGHHRRRRGRAGADPPGAGPPPRRGPRCVHPDDLPVVQHRPSPTSWPPTRYHVVFECSGKRAAMEAGLLPAPPAAAGW